MGAKNDATPSVDELADLLERRLGGVMLVRLELCELLERLKLEEGELAELLRSILQLRDKERAGCNAQLAEARAYARQLETELARLRASSLQGSGLPAAHMPDIECMTGSSSESRGRATPVPRGAPSSAAPACSPLRDAVRPPLVADTSRWAFSAAPACSPLVDANRHLLVAGTSGWGHTEPRGAHASQEPLRELADPAPALDYEDVAERLALRLASERHGLDCNRFRGGATAGLVLSSAAAVSETDSSQPAESAAREAACSARPQDQEHAHAPSSAIIAADGTTFRFIHLER
jgi:hypothetical protein